MILINVTNAKFGHIKTGTSTLHYVSFNVIVMPLLFSPRQQGTDLVALSSPKDTFLEESYSERLWKQISGQYRMRGCHKVRGFQDIIKSKNFEILFG